MPANRPGEEISYMKKYISSLICFLVAACTIASSTFFDMGSAASLRTVPKMTTEYSEADEVPQRNADLFADAFSVKGFNRGFFNNNSKYFAGKWAYAAPILGICLGMQLLGRRSEEGNLDGLGLIPFECVRFRFDNAQLKIPHMGWDLVDIRQVHPVVDGLAGRQRFYFVHSFHAVCDSSENVLMTCYYGYPFEAAVFRGNCIGVQFHPEKSHDFGLSFLTNFVRICRKG